MPIYLLIPLVLGVIVSNLVFATDSSVVRLATTTTTKSSGLLDVIVPAFERASGYRLKLTIVGTGRALRLGRLGKVDVVLVDDPRAEKEFVKNGWGVRRQQVMKNDFVLVGPANDPAGIKGMQSAGEALRKIAQSYSTFVSRGDDSGTNKKELRCWAKVGIEPASDWYYETGGTMGVTLKITSEKQGYTLVDRGTWLAFRSNLSLELLVEGDSDFDNFYGVIEINPERHPDVNFKGATVFSNWLMSPEGQRLIQELKVDGEQLYFPVTVLHN